MDPRLAYWAALEAPPKRVARALGVSEDRARVLLATPDLRPMDPADPACPRSAVPWTRRTLWTLLRRALVERPADAPLAHVAGEGALCREEVSALAAAVAQGLRSAGVGPGDRVAVDASQRLESYLTAIATLSLGAVLVRLGDSVGPETLREMVRRAPAKVTLSARQSWIGPLPEAGRRIQLDVVSPDGEGAADPSLPGFEDWLEEQGDAPEVLDLDTVIPSPSDPALIGYTSGSTGSVKLVHTSHEAVFRSSEVAARLFDLGPGDVFYTATDFTALSAFRSMLALPFLCGGVTVLPSAEARLHPLALALECRDHGVTRLTAIPNVLRGLVAARDRLGPEGMSGMRTVFSGSGVLDGATADAFRAAFPLALVDYYGSREIGTVAYSDPKGPETMSRGGGWPSESLIRILSPDGSPLAPGEAGEIQVHTDCLMLDEDMPSVRDGWYHSGDLGRFQADGRLEIVGRLKDIIKTREGGLVTPVEVETILHRMDEVSEACVAGWTAPDGIERIVAWVIPTESGATLSPRELEKRAQAATLAALGPYRMPERVIPMERFPRVGRDKPDKAALKKSLDGQAVSGYT